MWISNCFAFFPLFLFEILIPQSVALTEAGFVGNVPVVSFGLWMQVTWEFTLFVWMQVTWEFTLFVWMGVTWEFTLFVWMRVTWEFTIFVWMWVTWEFTLFVSYSPRVKQWHYCCWRITLFYLHLPHWCHRKQDIFLLSLCLSVSLSPHFCLIFVCDSCNAAHWTVWCQNYGVLLNRGLAAVRKIEA